MQVPIDRRDFLKDSFRGGFGLLALGGFSHLAAAIEPFKRAGTPRLMLSLAAYSFRQYFIHGGEKAKIGVDPAKRIDLFQFIDFCAEHGCEGTELTSYYFPAELTEQYLIKLKRHAFLRGIAISGTAVGNTFTLPKVEERAAQIASVKKWVDYAAIMGAPHIRIFAGSAQGVSKDEAKKLSIAAIEECADYAGQKGIFLGLENHGGIVATPEEVLEIIRAVKSPWFGVNLDTGNFQTDDPYQSLAQCAPYAVNVQIKSEIHRRGQKNELADLARLAKILRDANYQGYVALEYEAAEDPWTAVPGLLKRLKELFAS